MNPQTSKDAFEAYFGGSHRAAEQGYVRDVAEEAWEAAIEWLRLQDRSVYCLGTGSDECSYARCRRLMGDPRISVGMSADDILAQSTLPLGVSAPASEELHKD